MVVALLILIVAILCAFVPNYLKYKKGCEYLANTEYDKAIQCFSELKDYNDSKKKLEEAERKKYEQQMLEVYQRACKKKKDGEYLEAIEIFAEVIEYKDTPQLIIDCKKRYADQKLDSSEYEEALIYYEQISEVLDVKKECEKCELAITQTYFDEGDYISAKMRLERMETEEAKQKLQEYLLKEFYIYVEEKQYDKASSFLQDNNEYLSNYSASDTYSEISKYLKDNIDVMWEYASDWSHDGDFDKANKVYDGYQYFFKELSKTDYYIDIEKCNALYGVQGTLTEEYKTKQSIDIKGWQLSFDGNIYTLVGTKNPESMILGQQFYLLEWPEVQVEIYGGLVDIDAPDGEKITGWYYTPELVEEKENIVKDNLEKKKALIEKAEKEKEEYEQNKPQIGMTATEVENSSWGKPKKINKTTYSWGVKEQWCYSNYRYVYLENGIVYAISE